MPVTGVVRIWQFINVLKNRVQARTAANFKLRIALLLAFSVANVVLGGLIYGWLMPEESWGTSLFTVYAVSGARYQPEAMPWVLCSSIC